MGSCRSMSWSIKVKIAVFAPMPSASERIATVATSDPADSPLPVDPEPMRIITPNQSIDTAGLDAMVKLIPSKTSKLHYLLPLPPGFNEDSPEMFGFWTYELRAGHDLDPLTQEPVWSTAQARFGRPLRAVGVQHPAPRLKCQPVRVKSPQQDQIIVSAPFATPVLKGEKLVNIELRPKTQLWFLLYAQVTRADGAQKINVLIDKVQGVLDPHAIQVAATRDLIAVNSFQEAVVRDELRNLSLPENSPLSVLAVEMLPGADIPDPLGSGLGNQRILRTSPLTAVEFTC